MQSTRRILLPHPGQFTYLTPRPGGMDSKSSQAKNRMADQATETPYSKIISSIEENTSSGHFKINNSISQDNLTLDEYEKEFDRVMQEEEKQEICRRNAETVTPNCDISRGDKQSRSPVTRDDEYFIPIDCSSCELNPVQTLTQSRNNSVESPDKNSVSTFTSVDKSFISNDCAPCQLNPVQTPTQDGNKSEQSLSKNSVSTLTSGGKSFISNDCAPCQLNPVQTQTQGRSNSEWSPNKNSVSTQTSVDKSVISNDCAPCQLNPVQTLTQGRSSSEPLRNTSSVSAAKNGNESSIQIHLKKPQTQTRIKTHTQGLGNSELSSHEGSRIDYPPELNPFADDGEAERGKSTNPFGDSDDEENGLLPPKPRPRHSFSTIKGLEHRNRLPIPLPRTASKSVPTTPNQSPLLRGNHSASGSTTSTYNSIRRKKKPAPPPPTRTITDSNQSHIASPKTNSRPRKTRLAPPPPQNLTQTTTQSNVP